MSDEKLVAFDVHETIGVTPVNLAGSIPEAKGPVITECHTGEQRCKNCAYHTKTDYCTVRSITVAAPTTTVCIQWAEKNKQPVFGGTSLSELEAKAKVWGHQQEAAAIERGCQQGMILEMLDTVFDIACQQVLACTERWMKLKADLHVMLCRKWADEEMPK